jgi:hypothetical protein
MGGQQMSQYIVTVSTPTWRLRYHAIGRSSAAVADAALATFGLCGVSVIAKP